MRCAWGKGQAGPTGRMRTRCGEDDLRPVRVRLLHGFRMLLQAGRTPRVDHLLNQHLHVTQEPMSTRHHASTSKTQEVCSSAGPASKRSLEGGPSEKEQLWHAARRQRKIVSKKPPAVCQLPPAP